MAVHLIALKVADIHVSVAPFKYSSPMLFATLVLALERGPVLPCFLAGAVLLVVHPLPVVKGLVSVPVILAHPVRLVVLPLPFVIIAVRVNHAPHPVLLVTSEVALVVGSVRPN